MIENKEMKVVCVTLPYYNWRLRNFFLLLVITSYYLPQLNIYPSWICEVRLSNNDVLKRLYWMCLYIPSVFFVVLQMPSFFRLFPCLFALSEMDRIRKKEVKFKAVCFIWSLGYLGLIFVCTSQMYGSSFSFFSFCRRAVGLLLCCWTVCSPFGSKAVTTETNRATHRRYTAHPV